MSKAITVQSWIEDHDGPDWAVIIISDTCKITYISEGVKFISRIEDKHGLSGIHVRDLLIVCNVDTHPEPWMRDAVLAHTISSRNQVIPHD